MLIKNSVLLAQQKLGCKNSKIMKNFKLFLLTAVALIAMVGLMSCDEDNGDVYFIHAGDSSSNYDANIDLQALVNNLIQETANISVMYHGDYDEAVLWFNSQCDTMESESFTSGIAVLDQTTIIMELQNYNTRKVLLTRTVTFYVE